MVKYRADYFDSDEHQLDLPISYHNSLYVFYRKAHRGHHEQAEPTKVSRQLGELRFEIFITNPMLLEPSL